MNAPRDTWLVRATKPGWLPMSVELESTETAVLVHMSNVAEGWQSTLSLCFPRDTARGLMPVRPKQDTLPGVGA